MGRNIGSGNEQGVLEDTWLPTRFETKMQGAETGYMLLRRFNLKRRDSHGFTLLELVMVMTIIVILASIAVTSYQQIQLKAKETILKQDLVQMRKMLDQFSADKERLPQSLEELVEAGYLREVPIDPITENAEWDLEMGEDEVSLIGGQGIVDVHSSARGQGSDGKAYSEY
jgi:general secretion pathway protein G